MTVGLAFLPGNLVMMAMSVGVSARLVHALRRASCRSRPAS